MSNILNHILGCVLLVALCLAAQSVHAQKTDIITLINGDRITCDIKELERGLVRVKTDSVGTIYIEWLDIATIESQKQFNIETASGALAFGSISTSLDQQSIDVTYGDRTLRLEKHAIVEITRIKDSFWRRMDGAVGLGFSYKKANRDLQLNFAADAKYTSREHFYVAGLSALVSRQNDKSASERYVGNFARQSYIRAKWTSLARAELEQNTELDLKLRTLLQGGAVHQFLKTNRTRFDGAMGLALNDEQYFAVNKENRTSLELFGTLGYEYFKFNTPKADVVTRLNVFPSLTESDRIRTTLDAKVRWEIIKDLNWAITLYLSADNRPPETDFDQGTLQASGTDYGITTSIEWTY